MACPLKQADIAQLRKAIAFNRELEADLADAQAAGVPDIDELVARQQHLKQALSQLLETYEPRVREQSGRNG